MDSEQTREVAPTSVEIGMISWDQLHASCDPILMAEALYGVMGWTVSLQNSYVESLTSSTLEDDCIWR